MLLTPTRGMTSNFNFYFILNSQQHFIQVADILTFHLNSQQHFIQVADIFLCCLPQLEA